MSSIHNLALDNKKVLVRVDFNVPLNSNFEVTDNTRIKAALPTINHIIASGGIPVLMSHLGRPKNGPEDAFSLKHIVSELETLTGKSVCFAKDCIGSEAEEAISRAVKGDMVLLENLRFYSEEKNGDLAFAGKLAKLGDVYINDAFGTAHRAHASTAIIAQHFKGKKAFGLLMEKEIANINRVLKDSKKPFTAIIGGAKVSSKISIITELLDRIDNLIIGGGMIYTFIKAQGGKVGSSLVEDDYIDVAKKILDTSDEKGVRILLPEDTVGADAFSNDANTQLFDTHEIEENWLGLDIGPKAAAHYASCIEESSTILWNGPMGVFEMSQFEAGTKAIADAIVKATERGAFSLVGGGDSVAAVNKFSIKHHLSYVSTGGGALLEYLEGKELPGIKAIHE